MFKSHLAMIGLNETPNKKAKFWQSYIRSLKGSDDIRAHERYEYRRPFSYIELESDTANGRVQLPGYRYLPVHRETYGYSPRPIYTYGPHTSYRPSSSHRDRVLDAEKAWQDHLDRMREIDRRYPSRYGLYLKEKPNQVLLPQELEYEPDTKPLFKL
uniref:Putative myofilin n=1 Tax=Corethrella appendiculata TaxID=1370023 RepID=U5ECP8_9DIPT